MHPLDALVESHPKAESVAPASQPPGCPPAVVATEAAATVGVVATLSSPAIPLPDYPPPRDGLVDAEIPWPAPCPRCGSYHAWWDMHGRQRCQACGGSSGDDAKQFACGMRVARLAIRLRLKSMGMSPRALEQQHQPQKMEPKP